MAEEGCGNASPKAEISFYAGADYGLDSNYGELFNSLNLDNRYPASSIGFATDPRTANQISTISNKLNTGAKTIEVQGVSPQVLESMPKQQFDEIRRLKELTGSE